MELASFDSLEPAVGLIVEKCRMRKVPFAALAVTLRDARRWIAMGAPSISVGVDLRTP